jgi:drug/metabolite transporter (DMT)-like permease
MLATVLLLGVTAVWGSTFFLIRDLVAHVPTPDFLATRFGIAAVAMVLLFGRRMRSLTRRQLTVGAGLGLLYGAAQLLQTTGLEHTAASVSGFVTGTYVVLTPVFGALLLKEQLAASTWLAVALATLGLAALSLQGFAIGLGEALTFAAAVLYALHIVGLGRYSTPETATGLATVQTVVIALTCTVGALPGGITLPTTGGQWASLLYMALVAGAGAVWAQTWAQSHLTATRAAIVMTMEPVFAAFFAVLFGGERLGPRVAVGGALVVAAMYLAELGGRRGRPAEATAAERPPSELLHHEA